MRATVIFSAMLLFAADLAPGDPWGFAGTTMNAVGYGALLWFLLYRQVPSMQKQFSDDLSAERADKMKLMRFVLAIAGAAMTSPAIGNNPAVKQALEDLAKLPSKDAQ